MEIEEIVVIIIGIAFFTKFFIIDKLPYYSLELKNESVSLIHSLNNWIFYSISFTALIIIILYLNYKLTISIHNKINQKKLRRELIERETKEITSLLKDNKEYSDTEEISKLIDLLKEKLEIVRSIKQLEQFEDPLWDKLKNRKLDLRESIHQDKINELRNTEWDLEKEIEKLELEKREAQRVAEKEDAEILRNLNADENSVFKKSNLNDKELKALLQNGYSQANEFCIYEKKMITVLIKKILNHSKTHVFLVWSVKRLLDNYADIEDIQEHYTKDADITFKYKEKNYAIEVETGTLLGKAKQKEDKKIS